MEKMIWNKLKNNNLNKLTVENLEIKINEEKFDKLIIEELLGAFKTRMTSNGEQEFQSFIS
jgi:hypothetical protein